MNSSILGRAYALHILDEVSNGRELSFTRILEHLGISRGALSATLEDLVDNGLVQKRRSGRYAYYSITEKGLATFRRYSERPDLLEDRVAQAVYKRLSEAQPIDLSGFSREQIIGKIRPRVRRFIGVLAEVLEKELENNTESKKPLSKVDVFSSDELPPELERITDAKTIEVLREEMKRIRTLKKLSDPQSWRIKAVTRADEIYMGCKTTKIFCRLTCPCRMPKPENLAFFRSSTEAKESGYRACKVCKPV